MTNVTQVNKQTAEVLGSPQVYSSAISDKTLWRHLVSMLGRYGPSPSAEWHKPNSTQHPNYNYFTVQNHLYAFFTEIRHPAFVFSAISQTDTGNACLLTNGTKFIIHHEMHITEALKCLKRKKCGLCGCWLFCWHFKCLAGGNSGLLFHSITYKRCPVPLPA